MFLNEQAIFLCHNKFILKMIPWPDYYLDLGLRPSLHSDIDSWISKVVKNFKFIQEYGAKVPIFLHEILRNQKESFVPGHFYAKLCIKVDPLKCLKQATIVMLMG